MTDNPLYITGKTPDGTILMGGIFQMQDRFGLTIDVSFDMLKEKGANVDWLEALADCWLNDCLKFDSFARQTSLLASVDLGLKFSSMGAVILEENQELKNSPNPIDKVCRLILKNKRGKGVDLKGQ